MIKKKHLIMRFVVVGLMLFVVLTGCGKTEEEKDDKKGFFDATYAVDTGVSYSTGSDSDWSYGNQRKEFPGGKACYVRIGSMTLTDKGSGEDNEITVMYRFTGAQNCKVEISDGIATKVETEDPNVVEYKRTLIAKKEKDAKEDIVIFQYSPEKAESMT
uniref:hypothetical protein n=1 Tax=Sedimentibacter sp. B4 TaxID=304766 RepID=UPI00058EFC60